MLGEMNLNNRVVVRLDAKGIQILKDHYQTDDLTYYKSDEKEGCYELQFWKFIDIFGGTSCGSYSPYSCVVYVDKDKIKGN